MKLQPIRLKATDEEDTNDSVAGQTLIPKEAGPDRIVSDSPVRQKMPELWARYTDACGEVVCTALDALERCTEYSLSMCSFEPET